MPAHRAAVRRFRRLVTDTGGATLIEYAAITFLVSIAMGFLLPNFDDALEGLYDRTVSALENVGSERRDDRDDDGDRRDDGESDDDDRDGHRGRGGRHH